MSASLCSSKNHVSFVDLMMVGPGEVDGRAQTLVGPGLATPLLLIKFINIKTKFFCVLFFHLLCPRKQRTQT